MTETRTKDTEEIGYNWTEHTDGFRSWRATKMTRWGYEKVNGMPNYLYIDSKIGDACACKKCGKSRITYTTCQNGSTSETQLRIHMNTCVMEEGLCSGCDGDLYYPNGVK